MKKNDYLKENRNEDKRAESHTIDGIFLQNNKEHSNR